MLDFKGRMKWNAWNSVKGLSKNNAMCEYINLYIKLSKTYA